jgi:hypothetical protein
MFIDKYYKRNVWTDYLIQLFIFLVFIYFFLDNFSPRFVLVVFYNLAEMQHR